MPTETPDGRTVHAAVGLAASITVRVGHRDLLDCAERSSIEIVTHQGQQERWYLPPPGQENPQEEAGGPIEHEGRLVMTVGRTPRTPRRPPATIALLTLYFGVAVLVVPLVRDVTLVQGLTYAAPFWVLLVAFFLLLGYGRIRIMAGQVQVRTWRGTQRIPRRAIAQVVHVRDLLVAGVPAGYIALLDAEGKPLWRSSSNYWRPETIEALLGTGRERVELESLTPEQARTWWPHLLTWQLANSGKAALAAVAGVVLAVILAVVLIVLFVD